MNPYKMDFTTKTLTITKAFSDACADPNSDEYAILTQFQKDIPSLKIVRKTHKTPRKYRNASGETTRCNQFKNLTYENMERFMNALPASQEKEEVLKAYNFLRYEAGFIQTSAYKTVREWFVRQFPKYRSDPLFHINNPIKVIDITPYVEQAQKEGA